MIDVHVPRSELGARHRHSRASPRLAARWAGRTGRRLSRGSRWAATRASDASSGPAGGRLIEAARGGQPVLDADGFAAGRSRDVWAASAPRRCPARRSVSGRWRLAVPASQSSALGQGRALTGAHMPSASWRRSRRRCIAATLFRRTLSGRFTDPRSNLLSGSAWTAVRPEICAGFEPRPGAVAGTRPARRPSARRLPADRRAPRDQPGRLTSPRSPAPTASTSAAPSRSTNPSS